MVAVTREGGEGGPRGRDAAGLAGAAFINYVGGK